MGLLAAVNRRTAAHTRKVSPWCDVTYIGDRSEGSVGRLYRKPGDPLVPLEVSMMLDGIDLTETVRRLMSQGMWTKDDDEQANRASQATGRSCWAPSQGGSHNASGRRSNTNSRSLGDFKTWQAAGPAGRLGRPLRSARHQGCPRQRSTAIAACPTGRTTRRAADPVNLVRREIHGVDLAD